MYPRYASLVIAAFAATLTACGSDTTTNVLPGAEPVVSAPDYAVTLADGTIQLTVGEVKAFTASSRVKKSRTVRWSSSNTTVATVSSTGTVTAKTVGTALVTATASNGAVDNFSTAVVSGTTTVASAAKVASVLVSVPAATMTLGASQTATATARDSAGTVLTGRTVTWSVSSGTSLMVNASGVVTALAGGTESVVATVDGVKGAQTLTVATVTSVAVSPKTGTALAPAQTRQFTTVATWSDQVTRPVSITYTATGGTISTSGLYTAGQLAGTFMVIANCACGRADTAAVSIALPAQLTSLSISPKVATVNAGATQQFSAVANWSTGATTLPPITYSATGGVVSSTGLWTAPSTAGTYKVIVAHTGGTLKDTASVTVSTTTATSLPQPNAGTCPNEPAGYTSYGTVTFPSVAAPTGWRILGAESVLTSDATAPHAPTSVAFKHEAGAVAGQIGIFQTTDFSTDLSPKRVYSCTVFRQSENYIQNAAGTKFIYTPQVGSATRPIELQMYPVDRILSPGGAFRWRMEMQTSDTQKIYDNNLSASSMSPGRWYRLEFVAIMNTPGVKDGTLMWWTSEWNGGSWNTPVQNARHTNVLIAESTMPAVWRKWEYNLYYGGCCSNPLPADQFLELNRVYVSTAK